MRFPAKYTMLEIQFIVVIIIVKMNLVELFISYFKVQYYQLFFLCMNEEKFKNAAMLEWVNLLNSSLRHCILLINTFNGRPTYKPMPTLKIF